MDGPKRGAHCIMTTLTRTLTLTFYQIRPLLRWKLELTKVVRCLNRSWIHDSYHSLQTVCKTVQPLSENIRGKCPGGNIRIPRVLDYGSCCADSEHSCQAS